MEVIESKNGFDLLKDNDNFFIRTPNKDLERLNIKRLETCLNHLNGVADRGWTWLTRDAYYPSVIKGEIKINKETSSYVRSDKVEQWEKSHYTTEEDAKSAISNILPLAITEFNRRKELYDSLGFSIGFNFDGDYHGIYNEYYYISFQLEGLSFQFELNN